MHLQILEYLEAYTDHFGFRKNIQFRTEVTKVEQLPQGNFRILFEVGLQAMITALLVGADPRKPFAHQKTLCMS